MHLVDPWSEVLTVSSESDFQGLQEPIHPYQQRGRPERREGGRESQGNMQKKCSLFGGRLYGGFSLKDDDTVSQVSGHDEVVLHHKRSLLGVQNKSIIKQLVTTSDDIHVNMATMIPNTTPPLPPWSCDSHVIA